MRIVLTLLIVFIGCKYVYCQNKVVDTVEVLIERVDTNHFEKSGLYGLNLNGQDGKKRIYYTNGALYSEYLISSHHLVGTIIYYWPNGNVFIIETYKKGVMDGVKYRFHPNGELSVISYWDMGKAVGIWKYHDFNGKIYKKVKGNMPKTGANPR